MSRKKRQPKNIPPVGYIPAVCDGELTWVKADRLLTRHEQDHDYGLTDQQKLRVQKLHEGFADADGTPLSAWIDNFSHDPSTEREICMYERLLPIYRVESENKWEKNGIYAALLAGTTYPNFDAALSAMPKLKSVSGAARLFDLARARAACGLVLLNGKIIEQPRDE